MTRDEMIDIVIREWGPPTPVPQYSPLLDDETWHDRVADHERAWDARRHAWLASSLPEWLTTVADLVESPPDFAAVAARSGYVLKETWPWFRFQEQEWLLQIETMLEDWAVIEPELVSPIVARINARLNAIRSDEEMKRSREFRMSNAPTHDSLPTERWSIRFVDDFYGFER